MLVFHGLALTSYVFTYTLFNSPCWVGAVDYALLKNVAYPGKCLHIKAINQGGELDLAPCDPNADIQLLDVKSWASLSTAPGDVKFKFGSCLTGPSPAPNPQNGLRPIIWQCLGAAHQKWITVGNQIQGSNGKCLTAEGGGSYVDQWDCVNAPHQQWVLDLPPTTDSGILKNNGYPGNGLHIKSDDTGNWAELDVAPCNSNSNTQLLNIKNWAAMTGFSTAGGDLQFGSGRCVTGPNDGNPANGVRPVMWDCVGAAHQKYRLIVGNQLQGANGKCLTAEGGGSYLDQWDCVNAAHQQWTLAGA